MDTSSMFDLCVRERQPDESLYQTAKRLLTIEAMRRSRAPQSGTQAKAAKLIGVSPRTFNYSLEVLGLRPKDAKLLEEVRDGARTE